MKLKYNAVILCLLFIVFGCSGGGNNSKITEKEIYKGKDGLLMELFPNNPPEKIYENTDFQVGMQLTNKGPYEIDHAKVFVTVEEDYMEFRSGDNGKFESNFEGKEPFRDIDDFKVRYFKISAKKIDDESETHTSTIIINLCYKYKAKAFVDVCIDTDPHDVRLVEKPCNTNPISLSDGQGGPVMISRVEQEMLVDGDYIRPQFKIYIENVGKGSVLAPDQYDKYCSSTKISRDEYNKVELADVWFNEYKKSNGKIECNPDTLKLKQEQDYIICTTTGSEISKLENPYQTTLYIELDYGYGNTETRDVLIEKVLTH